MSEITIKFSDVNGTFVMDVPEERNGDSCLLTFDRFCTAMLIDDNDNQTWTVSNHGFNQAVKHNDPIMVFDFHRAPEKLRALSKHGGDEDVLVVVPKELAPHIDKMFFLKEGVLDNFVSRKRIATGDVIFIGAHA